MVLPQQIRTRSPAKKQSDVSRTEPRLWQRFYLLLTFAMGIIFLRNLSSGDEVNLSLRLIVVALLVLTLIRWTGAFLLALIQIDLFIPYGPNFQPPNVLNGFLWVMFSVLLLMAVSRYRSLQDLDRQSALDSLRSLFSIRSVPQRKEAELLWQNLTGVLQQLLRTALIIAGCAVLASVVMHVVPLNPAANGFTIREYRLRPTGYRALMLGLTLFAMFLPIWVLVNELVRRSLSRRQASVYLRSTFLSWIHRDLRMIIRKRLKIRRAKARALEPVSRDETNSTPLLISKNEG